MIVSCIRCGCSIGVSSNFCPFCGQEAPRITIPCSVEKEETREGYRCPSCGTRNVENAMYCQDCGMSLFRRKTGKSLFCPGCGGENPPEANFCYRCNFSLEDWFLMRGRIASETGYSGEFVFHETMNEKFYHFYKRPLVTIGRTRDNTIVLPCSMVSSTHLKLDLKRGELTDAGSTNGTFINRSPDRIGTAWLHTVREMNVAGTFTYSVIQKDGWIAFHLSAIMEDENCRKCIHAGRCNQSRNHYHIMSTGDGEIFVRKFDGVVETEIDPKHEYFSIQIVDEYYYFTDLKRNISGQLLLDTRFFRHLLPSNWEVTPEPSKKE